MHPNIVQVFDFGTEESTGRQYIVMEWVDGPSCAEILKELGRLEPGEAVDILRQACRGLDYAHRKGVVHRDVKPGNLLRASDGGQVKLADFGIAKAAEQSDITKIGSVLGTAAYLSPEQARGEPAGPQSDLYALGVVAYQLLAGRLPYEAASLTDLARQQDTAAPRRCTSSIGRSRAAVSAVVTRALAREPGAPLRRRRRDGPRAGRGARRRRPAAAAPALDETEATRMLDQTALTTPLARDRTRTAAAPPRRRMEPIAEPAAPRAGRAAAPPPRSGGPSAGAGRAARGRALRALLIVVLLAALAVGAFVLITSGSERGVQLREDVQGDVEQSIQQLEDLIRDNTR